MATLLLRTVQVMSMKNQYYPKIYLQCNENEPSSVLFYLNSGFDYTQYNSSASLPKSFHDFVVYKLGQKDHLRHMKPYFCFMSGEFQKAENNAETMFLMQCDDICKVESIYSKCTIDIMNAKVEFPFPTTWPTIDIVANDLLLWGMDIFKYNKTFANRYSFIKCGRIGGNSPILEELQSQVEKSFLVFDKNKFYKHERSPSLEDYDIDFLVRG